MLAALEGVLRKVLASAYAQSGQDPASHLSAVNGTTLLLSAFISAGTAALVTLSIEWLAKPRLEARKERILARCRRDAEIRRQLARIIECGRLSDYPRTIGGTAEQRGKVREVYKVFMDRADDAANALDDAISDMTFELPTEFYSLFSAYLGFIRATLASDNSQKRKGQLISSGTYAVRLAYNIPRWRHFRKRSKIALAEYVIRNPPTEDEAEVAPSPS